ncbi:MAG: cbb3-type cytochrome c oxidase subunit II [Akkermansiaceae bacterium]|nr:cbb3-type cytochrome c oxidase subunit II [Akkermansiaceae bacterium]
MISFFRRNGPGIILIAATYFYFLIFAQFAFIELLNADLSDALKPMMAAMALSGTGGSLITPLLLRKYGAATTLRMGLIGCGTMSAFSIPAHHFATYLATSVGVGLSLGILTVALTANLRHLLSPKSWGLAIGIGTGLAYAGANLPLVFATSPQTQAILSAACVFIAFFLLSKLEDDQAAPPAEAPGKLMAFPLALMVFLALVWLDSAAFFIIQHTPEIKANSWGQGHLWKNAVIHFLFALLAGHLLQKSKITLVTTGSFLLLALASLCLNHSEIALIGGWLYPAGVSLYSTALVACPVYLTRFRKPHSAAWAAAILYSIAGWFGSANGIGMAENLHQIPLLFLALVGSIFLIPKILPFLKNHRAEALVVLGLSALALLFSSSPGKTSSQVPDGREIYLSEGCIHCHSRYVRPDGPDLVKWGPAVPLAELKKESPVTIGNRRAGPDLLNVGNRRSRAWLKHHFIDPQSLSPGSSMPSYHHLFEGDDPRGERLIEFLTKQGLESFSQRFEAIQNWKPSRSGPADGKTLFAKNCAACHGDEGRGDGVLAHLWQKPPANLKDGPFPYSKIEGEDHDLLLARIIKFGIMGTDMPGHESLSDNEVVALAGYVRTLR